MHPIAARRSWHLLVVASAALGCSDSAAPAPAPGAPSNLVAAPLGGGVHLTWSDNSDDEELFEIERLEGEADSAFLPLDTVPFGTALYHDANVDLGARYTYRVRAKLPRSYSAYSNLAMVALAFDGGGSGGNAGQASTAGSSGSSSVAGAETGGSAGGPATGDVSFRADIVPLLVRSCGGTTTGCHSSDQAVGRIKPQYGPCKVIWYAAVDAPLGATVTSGPSQGEPTGCPDLDLYTRLLDLHSMLCDAPSWEQRARYVVPGDLDNSLIYQVLAGDPSMGGVCTSEGMPVRKMPLVDPEILPDGVELGDDGIAKIRDWILQGAKND